MLSQIIPITDKCQTQKKQSDMLFVRGMYRRHVACFKLTTTGDSVVLISPQPS